MDGEGLPFSRLGLPTRLEGERSSARLGSTRLGSASLGSLGSRGSLCQPRDRTELGNPQGKLPAQARGPPGAARGRRQTVAPRCGEAAN